LTCKICLKSGLNYLEQGRISYKLILNLQIKFMSRIRMWCQMMRYISRQRMICLNRWIKLLKDRHQRAMKWVNLQKCLFKMLKMDQMMILLIMAIIQMMKIKIPMSSKMASFKISWKIWIKLVITANR
jgi:hypothetical protein